MLARLMKYEIKATARWFLPLYATMLIIALINRFTLYSPFMVTEYTFTNPPADNSAVSVRLFQLAVKALYRRSYGDICDDVYRNICCYPDYSNTKVL